MDCCRFEEQMTRIIPSFAGFTAFTAAIPKMYWDVKSQEQRIFGLCKMLNKVICYADMLGENVDEIAKTLQDIEDGKLDPMIEAAIAQWFEDNQPQIALDIDRLNAKVADIEDTLVDFSPNHTVKDAIESTEGYVDTRVYDIQEQIGSGFSAEHTVADAIEETETSLVNYVNGNIRDMAWNCEFRKIVADASNTSLQYSSQGFTLFYLSGTRYIVQAAMIGNNQAVILYNYDSNVEVQRVYGTFGHINDITYSNGFVYALNESTHVLNKFSVNPSSLVYQSSEVIPVNAAGIDRQANNHWFVAYSNGYGLGIEIEEYDYNFANTLNSWHIPFDGTAVIQSICKVENDVFIGLTDPNTIIYFNIEENYHYYMNVPQYVGHVFVDEVEGVSFDSEKNLYFNTNSTVDFQLLASVITTNIVHNIQKEVDTSVQQNRYGAITAQIDYDNGSLVNPGGYNQKFKLAGDALNYAKSMGNNEITLDFLADYPCPIVIQSANVTFTISDPDILVELNGLIMRYSTVNIGSITRFILKPTNIPPLVSGGITYGAYATGCNFYIGVGTWHDLPSPDEYDSTHMKVNFNNSLVLLQDITYNRYYNCLLVAGTASASPTSIYDRTATVAHIEP